MDITAGQFLPTRTWKYICFILYLKEYSWQKAKKRHFAVCIYMFIFSLLRSDEWCVLCGRAAVDSEHCKQMEMTKLKAMFWQRWVQAVCWWLQQRMIITDKAGCWCQESRRRSVYFMSLLLSYWQATDVSWPAFENARWYWLANMFDMRMKIKYWPPILVFSCRLHAAKLFSCWVSGNMLTFSSFKCVVWHTELARISELLWASAPSVPPSVQWGGEQLVMKKS